MKLTVKNYKVNPNGEDYLLDTDDIQGIYESFDVLYFRSLQAYNVIVRDGSMFQTILVSEDDMKRIRA